MKLDRMLGIVHTLANCDRITARELAARFEVGLRTIHRDIEAIGMAGIPVVTYPGSGGGISLASHSKDRLAPVIRALRTAISGRRADRMTYHAGNGNTDRLLEPYYIAFQWSAWYVAGWCRLRDDFRFFKINRITRLELTDDIFAFRTLPEEKINPNRFFEQGDDEDTVVLLVHPSAEYRVIDSFGADTCTHDPSGWLRFSFPYRNREWVLEFIFGFADKARVLAPESLLETVRQRSAAMADLYRNDAMLTSC